MTRDEDHIVCLVKMILVNAMRLGAVSRGTIGDIIRDIASREDKTLKWSSGREFFLVLCAFELSSSHVIINSPATTHQARKSIREASFKAGIMARVSTHDLRRGSARDTAHLKGKPIDMASATVAAALGHSNAALQDGVTASYVGRRTDDTWIKRI